MKILAVQRSLSCWPESAAQALEADRLTTADALPLTIIPDSANVRKGTPLFVPDFAADWVIEISPAIVIEHLGKWISPRFAQRYYGALTLVARLLPPDGSSPQGTAVAFDGAVHIGAPIAAPSAGHIEIDVRDDNGSATATLSLADLHMDDTVALLSRYMTLKTGDTICLCRTSLRIPATLGSRISASINGQQVVDLKIR